MKKLILISLVVITGIWLWHNYNNKVSVRQNDISKITSNIEEEFKKISSDASLTAVKKNLMGSSTEGGILSSYYDKTSSLKKATATFYGENGKKVTEYYYNKGELIFCLQQQFYYNQPTYVEGSQVDKIEENRYYFHGQDLISWTDINKTLRDASSEEAIKTTKELTEAAKAILNGVYSQSLAY